MWQIAVQSSDHIQLQTGKSNQNVNHLLHPRKRNWVSDTPKDMAVQTLREILSLTENLMHVTSLCAPWSKI